MLYSQNLSGLGCGVRASREGVRESLARSPDSREDSRGEQESPRGAPVYVGAEPSLKLLVHAHCPSSYRVVKYLSERGLHRMLEIVPLNPGSPVFLETAVPSVPSLMIGGRVVAVDPLEPEFVEALLLGKSVREYVPVEEREVVERFVRSAKSSSYLMLHVLFGGLGLADLLATDFAEVAARAYFSGLSGDYIRRALLSRAGEVERELREHSVKSAAYGFLRDALLYSGLRAKEGVDRGALGLWVAAKLSQGVAYAPVDGSTLEKGVGKVLEYLEEHFDEILGPIENFLSKLKSDVRVYELLARGSRA